MTGLWYRSKALKPHRHQLMAFTSWCNRDGSNKIWLWQKSLGWAQSPATSILQDHLSCPAQGLLSSLNLAASSLLSSHTHLRRPLQTDSYVSCRCASCFPAWAMYLSRPLFFLPPHVPPQTSLPTGLSFSRHPCPPLPTQLVPWSL